MAKPKAMKKRITALERTVREQRDRLDRVVSHLNVTQDEDVARVLARHPDLRKTLPKLD
jgi:hypothetical protein